MSQDELQKKLREALAIVIKNERDHVSTAQSKSQEQNAARFELMRPMIASMQALMDEVGEVEGLEISVAGHGQMAFVEIETEMINQSLTVSSSLDAAVYEIEEFFSSDADDLWYEETKQYSSLDEAMTKVIEVVGRYIGGQLARRDKRD